MSNNNKKDIDGSSPLKKRGSCGRYDSDPLSEYQTLFKDTPIYDDWSANKKCGNNNLSIFSWYIPPPPPEINDVNLEAQDLIESQNDFILKGINS